ncbi:hypothetical protein CCH79_00009723, partial [Gambusia affinis]
FCNFTVTCKTVDSQINGTFQCENKTCRLLDQTHQKDSSLKISVKESSIICNHSNQVSWEKDEKNVSPLCENPPGKRKSKPEQTAHELQEPYLLSSNRRVPLFFVDTSTPDQATSWPITDQDPVDKDLHPWHLPLLHPSSTSTLPSSRLSSFTDLHHQCRAPGDDTPNHHRECSSKLIAIHSSTSSEESNVFGLQRGSSAVTDVFVKTGGDLILNLAAEIPPNTTVWSWQFTNKAVVTFIIGFKSTVQESHVGRVDVLDEKSNVKLKNLQKSDSGIYTAKVTTPTDIELTQYNVTVQDPVSPVNLTFNCSSSSSSYNLIATCRTDNSSISNTLRCENEICNQEGEEKRSVTKSGSSLHIYKLKKSIVCNHSNQVSKIESIENIENRCPPFRTDDKDNFDNTIYALPVANDQTETLKETDEDCSPTTTYSVVGPSMSKTATKTRAKDQPESVYSQIKAVGSAELI